jgi:hypothetical protein
VIEVVVVTADDSHLAVAAACLGTTWTWLTLQTATSSLLLS